LAAVLLVNVLIHFAGAAIHNIRAETEDGVIVGNAAEVHDAAASGTAAVRFGSVLSTITKRDSPLSPSGGGLGNFNLSSNSYIMGFRFVLDKQTRIDRWYFTINGEGADCIGGRDGYGSGNGGTHYGRIVEVNQGTGLPTSTVLASESINACTAHNRAKSEFDLDSTHQIHFVQFNAITLDPNKMYAFLLSNTDPNPGDGGSDSSGNHMSPNLNFMSMADLGPNGKNTLDANTPDATYGLDPRETTIWSKDEGATWDFGDRVGWYQLGSGRARMWIVGYRPVGGQGVAHGWPFFNWPDETSGVTVTYNDVPKDVTLTHAGAASETSAGTITVTNTDTGVSATTGDLGGGMAKGQLSKPVPVAVGQSYRISASGSVRIGDPADTREAFGLGTRAPWIYTSSVDNRFPALYASPHPYY
jgi:hypothetical protein